MRTFVVTLALTTKKLRPATASFQWGCVLDLC
jgi:hypothetical protein